MIDFSEKLIAFLQRASGADRVDVTDLRRLTGGASRETWSLDATVARAGEPAQTLPLILQRDTRGAPKEMSRSVEFQLMRAAFDGGVPAPEPLFMGDDSLGGEFFIVRRLDGETLPRRLQREEQYATARTALTAQLGRTLAAIHAVPLEQHALAGALPASPPDVSPAKHELARYEQIYRGIALQPSPAFELAFRYLNRSPYVEADGAAEPRTLVHGDFRIGNVLFGPEGLRLILDWELAHVGDPMEDMGWVCVRSWRFGGAKPVAGIGDREELFAAYEAAGGPKVDAGRVRFWEVYGNLRWGIICLTQARTYIDGVSNSVELAAIGRRTAETEWELLELVDG